MHLWCLELLEDFISIRGGGRGCSYVTAIGCLSIFMYHVPGLHWPVTFRNTRIPHLIKVVTHHNEILEKTNAT